VEKARTPGKRHGLTKDGGSHPGTGDSALR
jgi:hypothetical protein